MSNITESAINNNKYMNYINRQEFYEDFLYFSKFESNRKASIIDENCDKQRNKAVKAIKEQLLQLLNIINHYIYNTYYINFRF